MKKRALRKDFYMEIRKSLGRFLSIFFIVAMGVAFFSGIRASEPDLRYSGDAYFDRNHLMDLKVMGTLGLTENDVQAIRSLEGVAQAEPGYSADVMVERDGNQKYFMYRRFRFDEPVYCGRRKNAEKGRRVSDRSRFYPGI